MPVNYETEAELDEIFGGLLGWEGIVRYEAPYALYVEYDTAYAGTQPPFEPIHQWVIRNWSEIHNAIKKIVDNKDKPLSRTDHQERVAWFIVEQISESGIEGIHFGQRALDAAKSHAPAIVAKYAESDDTDAHRKIAEEVTEWMFDQSQKTIENEAKDTEELKKSGSWEIQKVGGEE